MSAREPKPITILRHANGLYTAVQFPPFIDITDEAIRLSKPTDTYIDKWGVTHLDSRYIAPIQMAHGIITFVVANGRAQYRITYTRHDEIDGAIHEASLLHAYLSGSFPACAGACDACDTLKGARADAYRS